MTLAEFLVEAQTRGDGDGRYAGGMTRGELDDMVEADRELRERIRAKKNGASPGTG